MSRPLAALLALLGACWFAVAPLHAQPAGEASLEADALEAARIYQSGEYAEAVPHYQRLTAQVPKDPLYAFLLAKCFNRTGRPTEALEWIDRAVAVGLELPTAHFERGRSLFLLERYEESIREFEAYHATEPGDVFSGMAHAESLISGDRFAEALALLEKLTPDEETRVRHQILSAAALSGLDREDEAASRLEQALGFGMSEGERTNIAGTIEFLRQPARGVVSGKPWWINLTSGIEYDTNVPTAGKLPKPRNPDFPVLDAVRGSTSIDGGYRWTATDKLAVTARLFSLLHTNDRLSERDLFLSRVGVTPEYRLRDDLTVGLEGAYSHLWLDQVQLTNSFSAGAWVAWRETQWTASRLSFTHRWETFYNDEVAAGEDPDGALGTVQFSQDFYVPETTLAFRVSYAHENSHTHGSALDYDADTLLGSVSYVLPLEIRANATWQHIHTIYHHPNLRDELLERRVNNTQVYSFGLSRALLPSLELNVYYTLTDAESNVKNFDYDRNVYGMSLTFGF